MNLRKIFGSALVVATAMTFVGCDKSKEYETVIPQELVHFIGSKTQNVLVDVDPAPVYNLLVGTTTVSSAERTITYKVTSPSAVAGTDYSIGTGSSTGTLTIPAGETRATIAVQPNAASYGLDDRDTLYFTLEEPSVPSARFQDTVILILRGPSSSSCDESNPANISALNGDYDNTNEYNNGSFSWGPYTTTISAAQITGPTTATVAIANIFDTGWGDIVFTLDWSDPANLTALPVAGVVPNSDAGDLNSTYAGTPVIVRPHSNGDVGTYSYCSETFDLTMQLGVDGLGYFSNVFRETLAR